MLFSFITHIEQTGVEQTVAFLALKKWGLFGANENMGQRIEMYVRSSLVLLQLIYTTCGATSPVVYGTL